jgi:hypothetical protein
MRRSFLLAWRLHRAELAAVTVASAAGSIVLALGLVAAVRRGRPR